MRRLFSLIVVLLVGAGLVAVSHNQSVVAFHQDFIEGNYRAPKNVILDLNDRDKVFWHVFSALDDKVTVYPSENYYYFIFKANGKEIWGNMRLSPEDREGGILNFAYWESTPDHLKNAISFYKQYGSTDGLSLKRVSDWEYLASYLGKEVLFKLHQIPQTPPKFSLEKGEIFVQKTLDESGYGFALTYNKLDPHFMFILDEDRDFKDRLEAFNEEILVGGKSGFAFYNDKKNDRKILIGINQENIYRNTYYDGPFDQLADNYIKSDSFKNYLEATYPDIRGIIDRYGKLTNQEGARVAITPYYPQASLEWLYDIIKECRKSYAGAKFYKCITYDQKEVF